MSSLPDIPELSADDLARAYRWAAKWHGGALDDFDGAPYLHHVLEVARAARPHGIAFEIVGVLHDTVEDTALPLARIEKRFGPTVATAVDAISRRPGEDFFGSYMPRVLANPIARTVKVGDAQANRQKALRLTDATERARYVAKYDRILELLGAVAT